MRKSWCDLKVSQWSDLTVDELAELKVCIPRLDDLAPEPQRVQKGFGQADQFMDVAIADVVPAGVHTPGSLHSVVLQTGAFAFSKNLLAVPSLGAMGWRFGLNYQTPQQDKISADDMLGPGWDLPQNILLETTPEDEGAIGIRLSNKVVVRFDINGSATAAGRLIREGSGSSEQYILINVAGTKSYFDALGSATAAPGRMRRVVDRYGNEMLYDWEKNPTDTSVTRLIKATDAYGREYHYRYTSQPGDPPKVIAGERLTEVEDFRGRKLNFQYMTNGDLAAVVLPSITQAASGNTYPNGRAYVFGYDGSNRLNEIWFPNECQSHVSSTERSVDIAAVKASADSRYFVTYDAEDRVLTERVGDASDTVGGTIQYDYDFADDSDNPITTVTDRNGNETVHEFDENKKVPVKQTVRRNRNKIDLVPSSIPAEYVVKTEFNESNQPIVMTFPEGNTVKMFYIGYLQPGPDDKPNPNIDENYPYPSRVGLLEERLVEPGSRGGSGLQAELRTKVFYDPIYNQPIAVIDPRGNAVDGASLFPPQNGGVASPGRYTTKVDLDYQQSSLDALKADTAIQDATGLSASEIEDLVDHVSLEMFIAGLGSLPMDLGDINGDGDTDRKLGDVARVRHPDVDLIGGANQVRWETATYNLRGQITTHTNAEGNVTAILRHPANEPDGVNTATGNSETRQYGYVSAVHTDTSPTALAGASGLVGNGVAGGDLAVFNRPISRDGNVQPSLNGLYQELVAQYPAYDGDGNALTMIDPRGNTATIDRTELGEPYRVNGPAPLSYVQETHYFPNRAVKQQQVKDIVVDTDASNQFTPTGTGTTANVPVKDGLGGPIRSGWFTHDFEYDLLDNLTKEHVDATGSTPGVLTTEYQYDKNQNLKKVIKPVGNTIEMDYDERNLLIAQREGGGAEQSTSFILHDKNGNAVGSVGPANRSAATNPAGITATVTLEDAFGGGSQLQFTGDFSQVQYDGFDRPIMALDPLGNRSETDYDPLGQAIESRLREAAMDLETTNAGTLLTRQQVRYDEASRPYEEEQAVFIASGDAPPSGREIVHTGGGLEPNSQNNGHTGDATLTPGNENASYLLTRVIYDRLGRAYQALVDNATTYTTQYDGVDRVIRETDPLDNKAEYKHDDNGNLIRSTTTERHPDQANETESFTAAFRYDVLDRLTVSAMQGADGAVPLPTGVPQPNLTDINATIVAYTGYDSRDNTTHAVDPRRNTAVSVFDGASRPVEMLQHLRAGGIGTNAVASTISTKTFYDGNSRPTTLRDANSHNTTYDYDSLDRPKELAFHTGIKRAFGYNTASDLTGYTDENTTQFAYGIDALGRRLSTSITQLAPGVIGNTGTVQSFAYDGLSRLIRATDTSADTGAVPNDGIASDFVHDGDQVCEERDVSPGTPVGGDTMRQYLWGNYVDELLQQREYLGPDGSNHTDLYPLSDLHYRTAALADQYGRIVESYDYDAYGNTRIYRGCGADGKWFTDDDVPLDTTNGDQLLCKHLYTGRYLDEETGLYYYRARYYNPEQGRFIQRDPAGYEGGMGMYEYAGGTPTGAVDPDGELFFLLLAAPFLIGGGVLVGEAVKSSAEAEMRGQEFQWALEANNVEAAKIAAGRFGAAYDSTEFYGRAAIYTLSIPAIIGAGWALSFPIGLISAAVPGGGYILGSVGIYMLGQEAKDIWENWGEMDTLDRAGRLSQLGASFYGGGASRSYSKYLLGREWGAAIRMPVQRAITSRLPAVRLPAVLSQRLDSINSNFGPKWWMQGSKVDRLLFRDKRTRKDRRAYERGQRTLRDEDFKAMVNAIGKVAAKGKSLGNTIKRGEYLKSNTKSFQVTGAANKTNWKGIVFDTWNTGPTPGVRWAARFVMGSQFSHLTGLEGIAAWREWLAMN